jgi:nucleoid DNA-binding protein
MKKSELARDVARRHGVEPGAAADQLDRVVNQIVQALRRGQSARLPGLGTLDPGKQWTFRPERTESK